MSAYRPYPKYKPSGVEWLGDVPEGWSVSAVKRFCETITDGAHISPETEDGSYPFVSTKDVFDESIDFENCLKTSNSTYHYMVRSGCKPFAGDVLFSKDGTIGRTVVVRENRDFVVASSLIIIRPSRRSLDPNFLHRLCQSTLIASQVESFVKGAGLPRLSIQNLLKVFGYFPPLPEQHQIATFLDRECGKLDALQAKQQRLIELLKEKRQALISHAVTRGLDPTANLKPSGIEWLGDLPEGWKRAKLSHYIETRKGVAFKADDFTDQGRPVVKATDIKNGTLNPSGTNLPSNYPAIYPKAVLKSGNIILSTVGSIPEVKNSAVGQICEVPASHDGFLLNQNTVIFSTDVVKLDQRFCFMLLKCDHYRDHLDLHAHGTANQASLNVEDMLDFDFPLPPLAEQRAIVAHLDKKCGKIDQLKAKAERGIELLKERRSALISAAVTGKIDVREVAAVSKRQAP